MNKSVNEPHTFFPKRFPFTIEIMTVPATWNRDWLKIVMPGPPSRADLLEGVKQLLSLYPGAAEGEQCKVLSADEIYAGKVKMATMLRDFADSIHAPLTIQRNDKAE
jgi:hypothetical protein